MSNQQIDVSGAGNIIRVLGEGSVRIGNQSVEVSGEGNDVVVASSGDLRIGGLLPAPFHVERGQVWAHGLLRVQVLSVDDGYARCLITDSTGKAVRDEAVELATRQIRRFYEYVGLVARPDVKRGQIWQHNVLARRYQVISVRNGVARCLVTDVHGSPIKDSDGKALIEDVTVINMRGELVGGHHETRYF